MAFTSYMSKDAMILAENQNYQNKNPISHGHCFRPAIIQYGVTEFVALTVKEVLSSAPFGGKVKTSNATEQAAMTHVLSCNMPVYHTASFLSVIRY